ncbi:MAG: C10 family peptidase [Muribaculaceae bacterium]|nr:C10 family peptidase [Muribaculaceae bacterium]
MRKTLLTSALTAFISIVAFAAPITPSEALGRFQLSERGKIALKSASPSFEYISSAPDQEAAWYAYNRENGGWVILSGDDEAYALLGFSDTGSFDYHNLPEAMKWWLSQYSNEIRELRNGRVKQTAEAMPSAKEAIAPMLATAWDQNAPFNLYTPEIGGEHTPTGCVATALAQFMKYYNYPPKGTGTLSYTMNGSNLSINLDETPFNWEDMLDVYGSDATDVQKDAVSRLMQACGYAVESNYGVYATDASVYLWLKAMVQNFGYAPSSHLISRIYMNNTDWDNAIYKSLAEGHPVLYSGLGSSGGHAFVCDGYTDGGYYHFNWGWAGLSNGYFLLSALNPTALGTGGGAGGFNMGQIALIDGTPDFEGSILTPEMGVLENTQISYSNISKNLSLSGGLMNLSAIALSVRVGFEIEKSDGSFIYCGETNAALDFPVIHTLKTYARKVPVSLEDGIYKVRPVFGVEEDGKIEWRRAYVPVSTPSYWTLVVADGKGTMEAHDVNSDIEVTDFRLTTGIYSGTQFKVGATIENKSDREFMSDVYVLIFKPDGSRSMVSTANPVDIMPGEKSEVEFTVVPSGNLSAGENLMALGLLADDDPNLKQFNEITSRISVNVLPFQADVKMEASEFYVEDAQNVNPENINLHITMKCVKGNYAYPVRFWIRPASVTSGTWGQMLQTGHIYLNEGESTSFTYTFEYPKGEPGVTYFILSNYVIPQSQSWLGSCEFTIAGSSGVDTPQAEESAPRYFNLQGVEITDPGKGIYIRQTGSKYEKVVF